MNSLEQIHTTGIKYREQVSEIFKTFERNEVVAAKKQADELYEELNKFIDTYNNEFSAYKAYCDITTLVAGIFYKAGCSSYNKVDLARSVEILTGSFLKLIRFGYPDMMGDRFFGELCLNKAMMIAEFHSTLSELFSSSEAHEMGEHSFLVSEFMLLSVYHLVVNNGYHLDDLDQVKEFLVKSNDAEVNKALNEPFAFTQEKMCDAINQVLMYVLSVRIVEGSGILDAFHAARLGFGDSNEPAPKEISKEQAKVEKPQKKGRGNKERQKQARQRNKEVWTNNRTFTLWNRLTAALVFVISAVVYLLTIEPTASFWDCGEFIASSYKLEVGHPPGNPVFQLFARFFTMFTGPESAAVAVNAMNAVLSALTIMFLYLTIVFLTKRVIKADSQGTYSLGKSIAIFGSGAVGALAYTFTDTFWFSAVEGEVYAMSSLFTALVFWAMTKWYEQADQPYANRWIVLISFLMGLSIGVHLLNLLAIPALVFMFYYKKREDGHYSPKQYLLIFLLSVVILAVILFGIIPYLPKFAAYFDLFFVNALGLPFNTGAVFFMAALLGVCFWGLFKTMKQQKVLLNTILLCFTVIVIGFSLFSIVVIRSAAKTPTNEYQPDNPFTLVRYLGREQYGSNPLVYGHYFDADYDIEATKYWAPLGDRYIQADGPGEVVYDASGKMLFPRMWSSDDRHIKFYKSYMDGGKSRKPTFGENLAFFFDYQMNWMYWRYFMWNFAGRQNDIHASSPGDMFAGNWESGIKPLDNFRLGDQSNAPDYLKNNKGKNHYYMLPLLLGLIGLFFQFARDKRGCWLTFLMFFMTGIAIVIYLNQPPYQVRERDYAYAGSFYFFCVWIGLAVAAVYSWIVERSSRYCVPQDDVKGDVHVIARSTKCDVAISSAVTILFLGVPALMASENWDDHDRSNRYTAVEMAKNYLNSVGPNGILVTHGDNDTFPLWYAQEVENVRPDVRIANTSLLGTDWHIDQMRWAMNESAPLNLSVSPRQYLYGTNEYVYIYDDHKAAMPIAEVMRIFKDPNYKLPLSSGRKVDFIYSRKLILPVNKENIIKYGILDKKYEDMIPESIVLTIPEGKDYLTKPELFMLDLLSNYQWDRPINLLSMGGDINIGLKEYLMYEGFSYKFVPVKNKTKSTDIGFADPEDLYYKMKNVFSWDALKRDDYYVDYQNYYTFCGVLSQRNLFVNAAKEMLKIDDTERAIELLDMCQECVPEYNFPLDITYLGFSNEYMVIDMIETYYMAGAKDKALELSRRFTDQIFTSIEFFLGYYDIAKREFDACYNCVSYIAELSDHYGDKEYAKEIRDRFNSLLDIEK